MYIFTQKKNLNEATVFSVRHREMLTVTKEKLLLQKKEEEFGEMISMFVTLKVINSYSQENNLVSLAFTCVFSIVSSFMLFQKKNISYVR